MKTDLIPAYLPAYIFNVLHIGSMVGLSFKVVKDYMRNTIFIEYDMVFLLMTLISMGSGIVFCNMLGYMMTFLFQTSQMGANKNLWISWHNLKLLVTLILFLPVYKFLPVLNTGIVTARFIWFVALIFLSPMAKFYREHYSRFAELKTQWLICAFDLIYWFSGG